MRAHEFINEAGGVGKVVKGVNTTPDVQPGEIQRQASKFNIELDKDGLPPIASTSGEETKK